MTRGLAHACRDAVRAAHAALRAASFVLAVLPALPSRPVEWLTPRPRVERVAYPTRDGDAEGDLYHCGARGRHPGVVVCLGVVPFG